MSPKIIAASYIAAVALGSAAAATPTVPPRVQVVVARPPQPDAATVAEAMHYLDIIGFEENSMRSAELAVGASFAALVDGLHKQFGDKVPQDLIEQLHTAIHDHAINTLRADMPELKRETAIVYASQFTGAELIRLGELQSDPVAVKARERAKVMQPELMMIGINAMRRSQPELDARIKQIIKDYIAAHGLDANKSGAS